MTGDASNGSSLAPGYKLDRYELLCPIAEGGMASVWVARQRGKHGFEKVVAIKTILPKFAGDVRFQEMFLDEARIASRIEHMNVAQIFDLGEEHDILYLAMEYVEGDALSKINRACSKRGVRIPTAILLRVLADTCSGLHEAHEMKEPSGRRLDIVHRDVSPHNILVSTKGVAKLIDFGIATAQSRAGAETSSGVLKGKIQYMAPEQALGRPLDRRADVWAIGAVLYALLSGRPPYEADNPLATLNLLGSGRPPMPLPSSVHPSIAAIVRRALSFSPDQRHATAADMRDAIERAMVSSQNTATVADVAAFAAEYISDRVEKRRHTVEVALAAALERQQAEERVRPAIERRSASVLPSHAGSPPWPPPSSGALPSPIPLVAKTIAEAPAAKPPSTEALARLTPRLSEPPPPQASSYATLGSAALDTSHEGPRSRKGVVAAVGAVVVAAGRGGHRGVQRAPPAAQGSHGVALDARHADADGQASALSHRHGTSERQRVLAPPRHRQRELAAEGSRATAAAAADDGPAAQTPGRHSSARARSEGQDTQRLERRHRGARDAHRRPAPRSPASPTPGDAQRTRLRVLGAGRPHHPGRWARSASTLSRRVLARASSIPRPSANRSSVSFSSSAMALSANAIAAASTNATSARAGSSTSCAITSSRRASRPSAATAFAAWSSIASMCAVWIESSDRLRSAPRRTSRSSSEIDPSADIIRYIASLIAP